MSISSVPPSSVPVGPINFKAAQAYAANRTASSVPVANTPAAAPKVTDRVSLSSVAGPSVAGKIQPQPKVGTAAPVNQPTAASKAKIQSIVAAQVPGKVSFDSTSASTPATTPAATPTPALPFYTNPTMKNSAATGIAASRTLDMQA